ncbi:hypothetical protein [Lacipirellula parvula]|uniref:PEP-CTERM protein-sorting domain-containing protein n=1 Tax=Lacipirellula parvula TaxID=2650471 RepID=A0A5K7XJ52_9BACT|nr:hypothetical protein [Lacipirellula parvula]BBO34416.1 hypothetical protein PLANPX_4028 [Lacipirellula parvula]
MKRRLLAALCACVGLAFAQASICKDVAAQAPVTITIFVSERTAFDGSTSYSMSPSYFSLAPRRAETLRGPSGTEYPPNSIPGENFSSWEDLTAATFGEWNFTSTAIGNSTDVQTYRFTVSAFARSSFPDSPLISPPNLSVVTSPFSVTWDPPSSGYGYGAAGIAASGKLVQPGELEFKFGSSLSTDAHLSFSTSAPSRLMNTLVSEVSGPSDGALYSVRPSLAVGRSLAVRYFPADSVPEPSALALAAVSVVVVTACEKWGRRLRRPQG